MPGSTDYDPLPEPPGAAGQFGGALIAMDASRSNSPLRVGVIGVSRVASAIGVIMMGLMVLHITVDVVCRFFDIALPGTVAFVANYYMVFVTFLPLVVVERAGAHIEVGEVITTHFPPRVQALLRLFVWILAASLFGFLAWEALQEAMRAYRARMFIIEQSIRFDTWLPYFVLPTGYFLAAVVSASRVALALLSLPRGVVPAVVHAEHYFAERPTK
jgi:TRAP-type C4-dicarboxylate transport system permease small subunit